ncbi:hypothetical protein [Pedobacter agri]|uniref:hypothetical protein n=1 Tax=Pedobacter agri TaxID=454586 RepID=UPI002930D076|nr:hypothetical protein [Pedobacter agri]
MKTSNKILICLAVALLTIPLTIMVLVAKTSRISDQQYNQIILGEEDLDKEGSRFVKKYDTKAFNKIFIQGADFKDVKIKVFKSNKFAVKITKDLADQLISLENVDGQIQIKLPSSEVYARGTIIVFSPALTHIKIDDVNLSQLFVKESDSLTLELGKNASFSITEGTKIKHLSITNKNLQTLSEYWVDNNIYSSGITQLDVKLNRSTLNIYDSAISTLDLDVNTTKVKVSNEQGKTFEPIENLVLKTTGECAVNFENIKINNAKGEISNSTSIQVPIINLKQMLQK